MTQGSSSPLGTSTAKLRPLSSQAIGTALLLNLPFVLSVTCITHLPVFLQALITGIILFLVPGLAWIDRRGHDGFVVLFRVVTASLLASLVSWLVALIAPGETNRIVYLLVLCAVTNVGFVRGWRREFYESRPLVTPLFRALAVCAALFFVQSYAGALHFVPALEDQDMETQGTAYGLMNHVEPTMLTNRGKTHFFAHPLLLHFWIGWSALIVDQLDDLRYYHESVEVVRAMPEAKDIVPLSSIKASSPRIARLKQMFSITPEFGAKLGARFNQDLEHFFKHPNLLATRTPNIWLAALTLFPLGFLVYRLSGSKPAAVGAAILYATLPEVYVRSSYGGYMAMTNFMTLSGAYFYLQSSGLLPAREDAWDPDNASGPRKRAVLSGYLGAWANQKWLLVVAAVGVHATIRLIGEGKPTELFARARKNPAFVTALLVAAGFFAGWASYAVFGLSMAYSDFLADHVVEHVLKRFRMNDVNLTVVEKGFWVYPSIKALWLEYAQHLNWLVAAVGVIALGRAVPRVRGPEGLFLIWFIIGAIGFSLIDWRMTKHLSKLLPPLVILTSLWWASLQGKSKTALSGVLGAAVLWNVWTIGHTMQNFDYLKISPIW